MKQRLVTLYEKLISYLKENFKFLLLLLGIYLLFMVELPYVIYTPGGAIDLEGRIQIEDGYESEGKFAMAYVSMVRGSLPFLALSYVIPNWDIEAKKDILYENETMDDMMERDRIYLQEAIGNASVVAYEAAGKELDIKNTTHHIVYIDEKSDNTFQLFDELLSVDGKAYEDLEAYRAYIEDKQAGDVVHFRVKRNEKEVDATATLYDTEDGVKSGISIITTHECEGVKVKSKSSESGPSGGLMTALAIYNRLVEEDITKGRFIIGTGTIDPDGTVGEIGGVKYKLLGAVKKHADLFLCPKENLEEAMEVKESEKLDITVVGVSTFEEALTYLQK